MTVSAWKDGDRAILDFATEPTRVQVVKATKGGFVYVSNVVTHTTYKVRSSRLSSIFGDGAVARLWNELARP